MDGPGFVSRHSAAAIGKESNQAVSAFRPRRKDTGCSCVRTDGIMAIVRTLADHRAGSKSISIPSGSRFRAERNPFRWVGRISLQFLGWLLILGTSTGAGSGGTLDIDDQHIARAVEFLIADFLSPTTNSPS